MNPLRLFALCLLLAGCSSKPAAEPVLIGHVAPLSGPDQAIGEHARQAILLAVEEANKDENRILGRQVAVLHADSQSDPAAIQSQAVRLIKVNKVAGLLLGLDAAQVENLGSTAQLNEVPVIMPSGLPGPSINDYLFYTALTPSLQGQILGQFAARDFKGLPILVLTHANESHGPLNAAMNSALAEAFNREFIKGGGVRAGEPSFYKNTAELKELIKPERMPPFKVIMLAGTADDLVELCRSGLDEKVLVIFGGEEGGSRTIQAAQLSNPIYLATVFAPEAASPQATEFMGRYQKRFGEPPDVHAALAYDDARILFEAMRQAKSFEGAKVQKALADLKSFPCLTGTLSFGADHVASRPVFIVRLNKDRPPELVPFDFKPSDGRAVSAASSLADPRIALYAAR